jgi:hypothetical protein
VCNGFEEIVLARDRLFRIEQRKLSARRMANLEGPLIEVTGTGPESIGTGSISRAINAVAPDAFCEVHTLAGFDHLGRRLRSQVSLLEPLRETALSKSRNSGGPRNHDDSEGDCGNHTGLPSYTVHHIHPHPIHPGWQ